VIAITTIVTILAAHYILRVLNRAKPAVIYERRKARQAKMDLGPSYYGNNESTVSAFNPNSSDSEIPLQPYDPESEAGLGGPSHQQWDERGRAIGYAPDPRLHAPRPRPPSFSPTALYDAPAAVTEDEWTNAKSPKTARLPDPASIPAPASAAYSSPSSAVATTPAASFPSPPQSPHSAGTRRRTRSPQLSGAEPQYITYHPEYFTAENSSTAQQQYSSTTKTEPPPPPLRAFSPPPSYQ
jgi:hypothetical protein